MFTSIAIIGRPNVGKSTLFNKLTKSRKAIVSDYSGLTKDRNYGYITFGEEKSLIIDTGGIAQDNSILKEDIAEQAWIAAEEASLIIFLIDGSENLIKEDLDILTRLRKLNKKFITVLNKSDKKTDSIAKEDISKLGIKEFFEISAEHSRNIADLRSFIKESLPKNKFETPDGKKIAVLGRPNAGKSTLINTVTNSKSKIGSYAFTTLEPKLGVMENELRTITIADLPGIIDGAAEGQGLGIKFLKHAYRTRFLLHLIDASQDIKEAFNAYETIEQELEKFHLDFSDQQRWLCLTKVDVVESQHLSSLISFFQKKLPKTPIYPISSVEGSGIDELKSELFKQI